MEITWQFTDEEVQYVREVVAKQKEKNWWVREREERNIKLETAPEHVSHDEMWHKHLICQFTTQQRSSKGPVPDFLDINPSPLSWQACSEHEDNLFEFIQTTMFEHNLKRFHEKIPKQISENYWKLKKGGWENLDEWASKLIVQRQQQPDWDHHPALEEQAANYIDWNYSGFGQKQARNFWQMLGLTRFVFVLDSRIGNWTRTHLHITNQSDAFSQAFWSTQSRGFYTFVSEILGELCRQADVLPCMFDAAAFAEGD